MFIIEILAIQNSFLREEKMVIKKASLVEQKNQEGVDLSQDSLLVNPAVVGNHVYNDERDDNFYIFKRYEISKLANKIFDKPLYFMISFIIVAYLYIGVTSSSIIAGNSLEFIIGRSMQTNLPIYTYYIIIVCFYTLAILISMNNIKNLKQVSLIIMGCRFLIIGMIFGVCIYTMYTYGPSDFSTIPTFNMSNITVMIGNSLFFFMSHHSIPGMVENFYPQKNLIKLLVVGYMVGLAILLSFGYVALFTFSKYTTCDIETFPGAIQVIPIKLEHVQSKFHPFPYIWLHY
jgi:hypothetical protein